MITLVTGFPRSGTSLVMRMLRRGGMPVCANLSSVSCEDDRVLSLPSNWDWLQAAEGKALKILDPQIYTPPKGWEYRAIWMRRNYAEQAKSQIKFLRVQGFPASMWNVHLITRSLIQDEPKAMKVLESRMPNVRILILNFEDVLAAPMNAATSLAAFTGLLQGAVQDMASEVVARSPKCFDGMMELAQLEEARE